jgi:hypothetical protein
VPQEPQCLSRFSEAFFGTAGFTACGAAISA